MSTGSHHNHDHCAHSANAGGTTTKVKDPVCQMDVDPSSAKGGNSVFNGVTYYFCNPKCKIKFDLEPEKYLAPKIAAPVSKAESEITYTCPMHPEIKQKGPGNCPICGMALEPEEVSLDEQ